MVNEYLLPGLVLLPLMPVLVQVLVRPVIGAYLVAFLLPIEHVAVIWGMVTWTKILGFTMLLGLLLSFALRSPPRLGLRDSISIVTYVVYVLLSAAWSRLDSSEVVASYLNYLSVLTLTLLVMTVLRERRHFEYFFLALLAGSLASLAFALLPSAYLPAGVSRFAGGVGDPNVYAHVLIGAVCWPINSLVFQRKKRVGWTFLSVVPLVVAVVFTYSRGALVTLVLLTAYVSLALWFQRRVRRFLVLLVTLVGVALALYAQGTVAAVVSRFYEGVSGPNPGSGRFRIWTAALDVIANHWLWGVGLDSFPREVYQYVGDYRAAHNSYLEVMSEYGAVGFLLFLTAFVIYPTKRFLSTIRAQPDLAVVAWTSYSVLATALLAGLSLSFDKHKLLWLGTALVLSSARLTHAKAKNVIAKQQATSKKGVQGLQYRGPCKPIPDDR